MPDVNEVEIAQAVKEMKRKKTPGTDNIDSD